MYGGQGEQEHRAILGELVSAQRYYSRDANGILAGRAASYRAYRRDNEVGSRSTAISTVTAWVGATYAVYARLSGDFYAYSASLYLLFSLRDSGVDELDYFVLYVLAFFALGT